MIEAEGALIDDLPERLDKFHYDLVATTTFHADEAQVLAAGRLPVVAMLVGPGYLELVHEIAGLGPGSRVGLVCANERGAENILETLQLSGTAGVEIVPALIGETDELRVVDETRTSSSCHARRCPPASIARCTTRIASGSGRTSSTRPGWSCCDAPSSTSPPSDPARCPPSDDAHRRVPSFGDGRRRGRGIVGRAPSRSRAPAASGATSTSAGPLASATRSTTRSSGSEATSPSPTWPRSASSRSG
jgi:hypothetical protein